MKIAAVFVCRSWSSALTVRKQLYRKTIFITLISPECLMLKCLSQAQNQIEKVTSIS